MSDRRITTLLRAKWNAWYALWIYLPYSLLARAYRQQSRAVRGVKNPHQQRTHLRRASWRSFLRSRPIRLVETQKVKGNVRLSELAVLAKAAANVPPGKQIVEIGTFDGRTTLNLAVNSTSSVAVVTLDLPKDFTPKFPMNIGEYKLANKPVSGARYRNCAAAWSNDAARIAQLLGDSASFDWSSYYGKAGLVFVDGSHTYENVRNDSEVAFRLVAPGGMIIWHDYGVWEEVTRALDEIDLADGLGLRHIRGTSLVFWRQKKEDHDNTR
jgi:predicted O-methyltransferase YrrM